MAYLSIINMSTDSILNYFSIYAIKLKHLPRHTKIKCVT